MLKLLFMSSNVNAIQTKICAKETNESLYACYCFIFYIVGFCLIAILK